MSDPADSSPTSAAASEAPAPAPPPEPSPPSTEGQEWWRGLYALWVLLARLMILGISVGLGWTVGVIAAQLMPSRNPEPPLQERVMRRSSATVQKLRQLPDWWRDDNPNRIASLPPEDALVAPQEPESVAPPAPVAPLPPAEQEQLAADLSTLQQDLTSLETRLAELEQQAGQAGNGSVEERLQQLAVRSQAEDPSVPAQPPTPGSADQPPAETPTGSLETPAPETPAASDGLGRRAAAPYQEPDFPVVRDRIVLPSALLFTPDGSLLTPAGEQLLDAIVADLRRYGPATLLVGSHTDGDLSAADARQLTFQQALAIQQYLAPQLEDLGGRWITLGYGKTRPVAIGDAPGTEQRNQRIEISIVPR